MSKMRKLMALLLAMVMLLSLAACGGGEDVKPDDTKAAEPSQKETQT